MQHKTVQVYVCMLLIGTSFLITQGSLLAYPEDDYTYTVNIRGEVNITGYTGTGGAIEIPATIDGHPVVRIMNSVFAYSSSITSVMIPDGVTSIGNNAFYYCSSLASTTIPGSVTSIGNNAFAHCSSLTSVTIPSKITTVKDSTFYNCISLTTVSLPDGLTVIEGLAFKNCASLSSIAIPDTLLTIGDSAFYGCINLSEIVIGANVTSIGEKAFWGCTSLTSVTIGERVMSIQSHAFYQCTSLSSISFLGLVAPAVGATWFYGAPTDLRGHAYADSNFPPPGSDFNGLIMGALLVEENKPPQASFNWTPVAPAYKQDTTFNASASKDPDGSLVLYEWSWNNDSLFEESYTTPMATHAWTKAGSYPVALRVTDNEGKTNTTTLTVVVSSGAQTPGFEVVLLMSSLFIVLYWTRKKR